MKKRERLEVINDILKTIKESKNSISPTPLLRKSNLSTLAFNKYINELLEKKFVRKITNKNKKFYSLTDKGFKYLNKYTTIISFIEDFGL